MRWRDGVVSERDGAIIGGKTIASRGITAHVVGAPMADGTWVGIGQDLETDARLLKLKKAVEFCDNNILQMLRTLGIQKLDRESIRRVIQRTVPGRREVLGQMIQKLRELVGKREESLREERALERERGGIMTAARIVIPGHLIPDVQVTFAKALTMATEPLNRVSFRVDGDEVVWSPLKG